MKEPLQLMQMDHTLVDVVVVDEVDREPIGRPWLTLAIDVATRAVPGFYLGGPQRNIGCPLPGHGGVAKEQVPGSLVVQRANRIWDAGQVPCVMLQTSPET